MFSSSSTLPGKSNGWRSLVACSPWGCEESDMTEQLNWPELNNEQCSASFHVFVRHLYVFFGEISVKIFFPLSDWVVCLSGIELYELLVYFGKPLTMAHSWTSVQECKKLRVYSDQCEVASLCNFDLHFSNNERCWASFHVFISHLYVFFGEMSVRSFSHFLMGCLFFWYWVVWAASIFKKLILCQLFHLLLFSPILRVVFSPCL